VAREIAGRQKEYVTRRTIDNYRHRMGLKPFHVIQKSLKTETRISDRLWLCDWLKNWTQEDFLHLASADEFVVWIIQKPNHQNDRIWAKTIEDIDVDEETFVHDKAPCIKANMTQQLIQDNDINFWGNNIWPGNSSDLNAAEHIGSILKDEVETRMLSEARHDRHREET
jgi:hypothetical protein